MKNPYTKFVIIFVVSAFVFQFVTNSILSSEVRGAPVNGNWFPGADSPVAWKRTMASIIYPVKVVLVGPLAPVFNDPDPAPPIIGFFGALYWSAIASVLYFLFFFQKIIPR
ncbi:MAG TPA: hypothetical protein VK668_04340 [Mucilaginibacter sp.]|nr:hypothetical protein [Mucilaginibacter sp.]